MKKKVPTGVAILAVLNFLGSLASLIAGIELNSLVFSGNMALVLIGVGLLGLVASYGLWTGRSWAWYLSMILGALGLIAGVWMTAPIAIIIDAVIVAYLLRGKIQKFFSVRIGWSW
jgi:hypothetical protein